MSDPKAVDVATGELHTCKMRGWRLVELFGPDAPAQVKQVTWAQQNVEWELIELDAIGPDDDDDGAPEDEEPPDWDIEELEGNLDEQPGPSAVAEPASEDVEDEWTITALEQPEGEEP